MYIPGTQVFMCEEETQKGWILANKGWGWGKESDGEKKKSHKNRKPKEMEKQTEILHSYIFTHMECTHKVISKNPTGTESLHISQDHPWKIFKWISKMETVWQIPGGFLRWPKRVELNLFPILVFIIVGKIKKKCRSWEWNEKNVNEWEGIQIRWQIDFKHRNRQK